MTEEEFFAMPEIASYFPLTFEPHAPKARWNRVQVRCADCDVFVEPTRTRGYITPVRSGLGYRDAGPPAYHMMANALCASCNRLTRADYTLGLSPDGHLTMEGKMKDGRDGYWVSSMDPPSWWQRLRRWLRHASPRQGDGTEKA